MGMWKDSTGKSLSHYGPTSGTIQATGTYTSRRLHTRTTVNLERRQRTRHLNWWSQNHQDRLLYKRNTPSDRRLVIFKNNGKIGSPKRCKQRVTYAQPKSGINATTTKGCEGIQRKYRKETSSSCALRGKATKNRYKN